MTRWESWSLRVETMYHGLASAAILVAGIWAAFIFRSQREGIWNVDLNVETEEVPVKPSGSLLLLRVNIQNHGRVNVRPDSNGLRLTVTRVPDGLETPIVWRDGQQIENGQTVLREYNMLRHYGFGYEIEPGARYQETEALRIESPGVYLVTLKFFGPDHDYITQYAYVHALGKAMPRSDAIGPAAPPSTSRGTTR